MAVDKSYNKSLSYIALELKALGFVDAQLTSIAYHTYVYAYRLSSKLELIGLLLIGLILLGLIFKRFFILDSLLYIKLSTYN